jgi:hypothetical protein
MEQQPSETVELYITRLRQKAIYCNFADVDENIRDQIIEKCSSKRLRRKLLERHNVTLQQLREIAQSLEASEKQQYSSFIEQPIEAANNISGSKFDKRGLKKTGEKTCYSCGYSGHIKSDPKCPAKGKKCRRCKKEGHFEKCCKAKLTFGKPKQRHASVRNIETFDSNDEEDSQRHNHGYVFTVHTSRSGNNEFMINVGGREIPAIIDSGATVNIIDGVAWEDLKHKLIKCETKLSSKLYAYGSDKPLTVAGSFIADVRVKDGCVSVEFFVVEEESQTLLGQLLN